MVICLRGVEVAEELLFLSLPCPRPRSHPSSFLLLTLLHSHSPPKHSSQNLSLPLPLWPTRWQTWLLSPALILLHSENFGPIPRALELSVFHLEETLIAKEKVVGKLSNLRNLALRSVNAKLVSAEVTVCILPLDYMKVSRQRRIGHL